MKTPETVKVSIIVGNRAYSEVLDTLSLKDEFESINKDSSILFEEWIAEAVITKKNSNKYKHHFVSSYMEGLSDSLHSPDDCLYNDQENEELALSNTVVRVEWDEDL